MSTEQLELLEQLGQRAVACSRWRWMPGMRTAEGWRVIRNRTESSCMAYDENPENWQVAENYFRDNKLPDLSDPATMGCLLALVRTWIPDATVATDGECWWIADMIPALKSEPSEAAALVAALEDAR